MKRVQPDLTHYRRRRASELQDPAFREAYEQARTEIAQVDTVMRQLDALPSPEAPSSSTPECQRGTIRGGRYEITYPREDPE